MSQPPTADNTYPVEVQPDFIQKLARVSPVTALAELVWNSLDADAEEVTVTVDEGVFGRERILVKDDGTGFPYEDAPKLFRQLGNSWKRTKGVSGRRGRYLHGFEGQGRFKALSLGRIVTWHVVHQTGPKAFQDFDVWVKAESPSVVHVSELRTHESAKPGVTVTIEELADGFTIIKGQGVAQALCEILASYLRSYPDVRVVMPVGPLDPQSVITATKTVALPPVHYGEIDYTAELELVHWSLPTDRFLYFCDERGLSQGRTHLRIHAPGFNVSAHLKSKLVPKLALDGVLGLEEMHPSLSETLERVGDEVKSFHRERLSEDAQAVVDEWKHEAVYPYTGEPVGAVERIERQVFDIVASRVNRHMPDFTTSSRKSKQLQLRLLRQAIEKSPEDLRAILSQVLDLPQQQRKELAELLDYVSLTGIISAARLVADRLQFLAGLDKLLFSGAERKQLLERKQLHRMLVGQTWIFGEEFALSVDDQSLNEALRRHLDDKNIDDVDLATPVLRPSGKKGIIDLMLSRRIPRGHDDEREHLIVELKRPKVKVGQKELGQIKEYALAVANDDRFRHVKAKWEFWLLTTEYDSLARAEARQAGRPPGLVLVQEEPPLRLWLKTWAEVLEENRARLQFIQKNLGYEPDQEDALQKLKLRFADLFAVEEQPDGESEEQAVDGEKQAAGE